MLLALGPQTDAKAIQILRVIEKCCPHVNFEFQEHLLGGVSMQITAAVDTRTFAEPPQRLQLMLQAHP